MKIRSLDKDPVTTTLGEAMLLINANLEILRTSTPTRLDCHNAKEERYTSFQGSERELQVLSTLHSTIGPMRPLELLRQAPAHFKELRSLRSDNEVSRAQGRITTLLIFRIPVPPEHMLNQKPGAFNKWLKTIELPAASDMPAKIELPRRQ